MAIVLEEIVALIDGAHVVGLVCDQVINHIRGSNLGDVTGNRHEYLIKITKTDNIDPLDKAEV